MAKRDRVGGAAVRAGGGGGGPSGVPAGEPALAALSAPQRAAIERLAAGGTPADAAAAVGVGRSTVYRWLKADPAFAAAYHAWQAEAVHTARGRLLALADAAVGTVAAATAKGDVRTALTVLKGQGLLTPPTPGSDDPATLAHQDRQRRARENYAMIEADERIPPSIYAPEVHVPAAAANPSPDDVAFEDRIDFADPNAADPNAADLARLDAAFAGTPLARRPPSSTP